MVYRIVVETQPGQRDVRGEKVREQIALLGVAGCRAVAVADLYFLAGALDDDDVARLIDRLLCDPVSERARWRHLDRDRAPAEGGAWTVEVALRPGVTDSAAESLLAAAPVVGVAGLARAATGTRYRIAGDLDRAACERIASDLLANGLIQRWSIQRPIAPPFVDALPAAAEVETVPLLTAADAALCAISEQRRLALDLDEMRALQQHFRVLGREPTDVEIETIAQTWSEHCSHKSFGAIIEYDELDAQGQPVADRHAVVDSLLSSFIRAATERLARPWVRSAFVDNAGVIAFDRNRDLAFKVETHNHPSALEPFGGASTGVGGVIRDVIGVSAWPIAATDVLCFGPLEVSSDLLAPGVLHPQRVAEGVVSGIEDYGNKMGIPTVAGAVLHHPGYTANPLVFCGCLGILPAAGLRSAPQLGDRIVVLGGRTGRDGLRGATFSSLRMDRETGPLAGSAVQIGHPIHERQLLEAVIEARDAGLYRAITDCGAGGLASAVGELAAEGGARVQLDRVPTKYPGLAPWEIWLSEAQERMVLAVPDAAWPRLQQICDRLDVEVTAIGRFSDDGQIALRYGEQVVGRLDTAFLYRGQPRRRLRATWQRPRWPEPALPDTGDLTADLLALLARPETRSPARIVRRYDCEVQAATIGRPLIGVGEGPGDAAVIAPMLLSTDDGDRSRRGVAIGIGINPFYGEIDPYAMAWAAVDEALRNCVAVGADPDRVSLLDNFCWGDPRRPDCLGGLVRCARGCRDAALTYGAPFISGKDSLNNEFVGSGGELQAIPGTLLISALAVMPDATRSVTSDLKQAGDLIYVVGTTADELGGSSYWRLHGAIGNRAPRPPADGPALLRAVHRAIADGLVAACHDCSEGGLAVALAEMCIGGLLGADLDLARVPRAGVDRDVALAFGESLSRFVVEIAAADGPAFEQRLAALPHACAGQVRTDQRIVIRGLDGHPVVDTDVATAGRAWGAV
ncbi:MAG: phosphoribosylformylglycinamidine synthase subunit PurL [Deltaproteobacteria bacterium]|nr:phosphoribosylformylglycinamidine synthase subunit PurL [Deltaproteobacteria bacterium]